MASRNRMCVIAWHKEEVAQFGIKVNIDKCHQVAIRIYILSEELVQGLGQIPMNGFREKVWLCQIVMFMWCLCFMTDDTSGALSPPCWSNMTMVFPPVSLVWKREQNNVLDLHFSFYLTGQSGHKLSPPRPVAASAWCSQETGRRKKENKNKTKSQRYIHTAPPFPILRELQRVNI